MNDTYINLIGNNIIGDQFEELNDNIKKNHLHEITFRKHLNIVDNIGLRKELVRPKLVRNESFSNIERDNFFQDINEIQFLENCVEIKHMKLARCIDCRKQYERDDDGMKCADCIKMRSKLILQNDPVEYPNKSLYCVCKDLLVSENNRQCTTANEMKCDNAVLKGACKNTESFHCDMYARRREISKHISKTYRIFSSRFSTFLNATTAILFLLFSVTSSQELPCCSKATGSCRSVCEKMSVVNMAASNDYLESSLQEMKKYCAIELNQFWNCLNSAVDDISWGNNWPGRACCFLPQGERCRRACATASSRADLSSTCRHSDELTFYACLERQDVGVQCCSQAASAHSACARACMALFRGEEIPGRDTRSALHSACASEPRVLQCARNYTRVTPATNPKKILHCCDKTNNSKCRETCKNALKSKTSQQEIVESLTIGGCGPPLPHNKLWQCFLSSESIDSPTPEASRIDRLGMDSVKLQCCSRAESHQCRKLCSKTFGNDLPKLWDEFNQQCLSQISEEDLRTCISEVEEPCELGCEGLSYCTNFNNRPTELFRSCNKQTDDAARIDVALWQQQGNLSIFADLHLPVRNISHCSPNMWKAVACTLQIQPCSRHSHVNQICREDCYDILSQCMDWSRISPDHTATSICSKLSPDDPNTPCVSIKPFLEPSDYPYRSPNELVRSPCKGDPCGPNEVCTVNHNCRDKRCAPYTCSKGCKLGEASQYLVAEGTYVRIPITHGKNGCLKICKCIKGNIEQCQPLPCILLDSCMLGSREIEHGTSFYMDCNVCSCFSGEIVCSKRQCEISSIGGPDPAFTSLPCNCPPHHVPVCGRNGKTFPSACLAKCAGLSDSDFEFGPCKDPCQNSKCGFGEVCVPDPKVCLSLLHKPCLQYECVNTSTHQCIGLQYQPVCDILNREYPDLCVMKKYDVPFAYRGHCLNKCRISGQVCGINGVTYSSECTAWADYSSVDYMGPCIAIGLIGDRMKKQCSDEIICPDLPDPKCMGYTPPGACCPVCAGALKLIYSRKQIDRALYALRGQSMTSLTLQSILKALEKQIRVAECVLRGYLSIELDIFVIVQSTEQNPSSLQLEACVREAEKLASLIRRHSPRISSDLSLSALTAATVVHGPAASGTQSGFQISICVLIYAIVIYIWI